MREAEKQREIDAAKERMAQIQNEQYERALKAWVSSDDSSLVHYIFSLWRDCVKEAAKQWASPLTGVVGTGADWMPCMGGHFVCPPGLAFGAGLACQLRCPTAHAP